MKVNSYRKLILFSLISFISAANSMDEPKEKGINDIHLTSLPKISSSVSGDDAFSIDEYGNVEFYGSVKISNIEVCSVPIGGIIDWYKPQGMSLAYPSNFLICDGSKVTDPESPFYNLLVPNLKDQFVKGVTTTSEIGSSGGSSTINFSGSTDFSGEHTHILSGHTANISSYQTPLTYTSYYVHDDNQGWTQNCHLAVDGGDSKKEGHHRHSLDDGGKADLDGDHCHNFDVKIMNYSPPYYGLLKIIRIK